MNSKILTIVLALFVLIAFFVVYKFTLIPNKTLVSPGISGIKKMLKLPMASPTQTLLPQTPSYNVPKVIEYDSYTDLKQELESINPEVLDEDFQF